VLALAAFSSIFKTLENASKQLSAERQTGRAQLLQQVAQQHIPTATARAALETLGWTDLVLYHSWRLADSLRIASGNSAQAAG
jgi:hypothetical protein